MRRREFCLGLIAMPALARSAMAQEVSSHHADQAARPAVPADDADGGIQAGREARRTARPRLISRPTTARSAARSRSSMG